MEAIIFCGIQATGKSTFFLKCFFKTHLRISLDQLNTRNKEQQFMELCLKLQQPYVIDNTNPTVEERSRYIDAAKERKFKVKCYYFQSVIEDALMRNSNRSGKECIPEVGIKGTYKRLVKPSYTEGFDEIFYVLLEESNFFIKKWEDEI